MGERSKPSLGRSHLTARTPLRSRLRCVAYTLTCPSGLRCVQCPYSEKVWLALELKGLAYSTVLIDNTGGGRPSWYRGQTPQIQWADGSTMGESMDIVKRLDIEFPDSRQLYPPPGVSMSDVSSMVSAFRGAVS